MAHVFWSRPLETESRPNNSVAVHRGPLHYAYDIPRNETVLTRNALESRAVDLQFEATGTWQYAIDPTTLKFNNNPPQDGTLPSPVFDKGLPPFTITASACEIDWAIAGSTFASAPPENVSCTGNATELTLWPFGVSRSLIYGRDIEDGSNLAVSQATKLRIGEFPTFDSSAL